MGIITFDNTEIREDLDDALDDAAIGYDEIVYGSTLGNAMRNMMGQFANSLFDDVEIVVAGDGYINSTSNDNTLDNPNVAAQSGGIYKEVYSEPVEIGSNDVLLVTQSCSDTAKQLWFAIACYDKSGGYIGRPTVIAARSGGNGGFDSALFATPYGACYARVTYRSYSTTTPVITTVKRCANADELVSLVSNFGELTYADDFENVEPIANLSTTNGSVNTALTLKTGLVIVDASELEADSVVISPYVANTHESNASFLAAPVVKVNKGDYGVFPMFNSNGERIRCRIYFNGFVSGQTNKIKIYNLKISSSAVENSLALSSIRKHYGEVPIRGWENKVRATDNTYVYSGTRVTCLPIDIRAEYIEISLSNAEWSFAVASVDEDGKAIHDTGWLSQTYNPANYPAFSNSIRITLKKNNDAEISPLDVANAGITVTAPRGYYETIALKSYVDDLTDGLKARIDTISKGDALGNWPLRFSPLYDHLFVADGANTVIPHESLFHVRLSRRLGFNVIEANLYKTSDGVFIVNHLTSGKFGAYFHHVDGTTDISNISVSSVTWDWIVQNVRYNTSTPKYRTRPPRLEEFLAECKQQNVIPFATTTDADAIAILDEYMGASNYIAYGGTRDNCPNAIIYHWCNESTKDAILAYCQNIGAPFIYGMSNPTDFTDSELEEIVGTLHENGFWIGVSYADADWHKYSALGFDVNGSQTMINRISKGTICNLSSVFGFDDFTYTNATESNGELSFSSMGTITPNIDSATYQVCGVDVEMVFDGVVSIPSIGEFRQKSYTSDGSVPVFFSAPILNGTPKFSITCGAGTVVTDLTFIASEF